MKQIARNVTMDEWGILEGCRDLIHDRDTKFTDSFRAIVKSSHVDPLKLPARSPNLNAYAERWVKSVKDEALSKQILLGEASLRHVLSEYLVSSGAQPSRQRHCASVPVESSASAQLGPICSLCVANSYSCGNGCLKKSIAVRYPGYSC